MSLDQRPARGPLAWTAAVAAVAGLGAMGLVQYLAQTLETRPRQTRPRLVGTIADPEVTGSIALAHPRPLPAGARSVPLDAGAGRERLLVRGPFPAP